MMDVVKSAVAGASPIASAPTLPAPTSTLTPNSADKTARDFEAVFIGQMTKMMMETVEAQGSFSGGHGEEMFRGMLAEKMGGAIAARGGIGLAPAVMKQIVALQQATGQQATGPEAQADAR